jgi:hypothetical protein
MGTSKPYDAFFSSYVAKIESLMAIDIFSTMNVKYIIISITLGILIGLAIALGVITQVNIVDIKNATMAGNCVFRFPEITNDTESTLRMTFVFIGPLTINLTAPLILFRGQYEAASAQSALMLSQNIHCFYNLKVMNFVYGEVCDGCFVDPKYYYAVAFISGGMLLTLIGGFCFIRTIRRVDGPTYK